MPRYEAVLFDFDGVIVDSEPVHFGCWLEILTPFGIPLDWDTYSENCIGVSDRAMLAFLCGRVQPPVPIDALAAEYPRKKDMFRDRMLQIGLSADVCDLIRELRPNYKLAVVTSSGIREVEPILEAAGVMDLLDTVVHGGSVQRHKPAPDPYLLAVERLGVRKALVVEDSAAGIAAARAAGLDVVPVPKASDVCTLVRQAL